MKKLILNLFFVAAAIACGIYLSQAPWQMYRHVKEERDAQVQGAKQAEARHAQELIEEAHLSSTAGREELARRRGLHKPNEILLTP